MSEIDSFIIMLGLYSIPPLIAAQLKISMLSKGIRKYIEEFVPYYDTDEVVYLYEDGIYVWSPRFKKYMKFVLATV